MTEIEPNDDPAQATAIPLDAVVAGNIAPAHDVDYYSFHVGEPGLLSVRVLKPAGSTLDSRLDLYNVDSPVTFDGLRVGGGGLLVSSDGRSATDDSPAVDQILLTGDYYLRVSGEGTTTSTGTYSLTTAFIPLSSDVINGLIPDVNPGASVAIVGELSAVVQGDFNQDGIADLAVADRTAGTVTVLLGVGDGSFDPPTIYSVVGHPEALEAQDFNHDGRLDLAALDRKAGIVTILPGLGDGTFAPFHERLTAGDPRVAGFFSADATLSVLADFNRDGVPDQAEINSDAPGRSQLSISLGVPVLNNALVDTPFSPTPIPLQELIGGNFFFLLANGITSVPTRSTPLFADFNGDGIQDVVIVSRTGDILFRAGRETPQGPMFDAPILVNPLGNPRARAVTVVEGGPRPRLAAVDLFSNTISLYRDGLDGRWERTPGPTTGMTPTAIVSADLDGDGRPDLVVANSLFGLASLSLYVGQADGSFRHLTDLHDADIKVGTAISDLQVADVDRDGRPDLLLTNPDAGDVSVLLNDTQTPGNLQFQPEERYRAGAGLYGEFPSDATSLGNLLFELNGLPPVFPNLYLVGSNEATRAVASGDFIGDGVSDLITVNNGSNTIALLEGKKGPDGEPTGGFLDPRVVAVGDKPTAVRTGHFDGDKNLDLAVLNAGDRTVTILDGDGAGNFTPVFTANAGDRPTDLTVRDVNGDGLADLVIGNVFGDVLVLLGNGDGTFQAPAPFTGDHAPLDVQPLKGDNTPFVLIGNQAASRVSVAEPVAGGTRFAPVNVIADDPATHLAPGAVRWTKLEGPATPFFDAVVIGSGSNSVRVYHAAGFDAAGRPTFFAPDTYTVGTEPVSVTIGDLNGDGIPDMVVANKGSNDVSILFGGIRNGRWFGTPGPRLKAGGRGPVAVTVRSMNGDSNPDLVVTNSDGEIAVLPGRGQGFFDDRAPQILNVTGAAALNALSFPANGNIGLATTEDGGIVAIDLDSFTARVVFQHGTGPAVSALEALADNEAVVAFNNGTVAELAADSSGRLGLTRNFAPLAGELTDPSALQVFDTGTGIRVLVTNAGQDQVIVFAPLPPTGPTTEIAPSQEMSLTVIVTLLFSGETAGLAASNANSGTSGGTSPGSSPPATSFAGGDDSNDDGPNGVPLNPNGLGVDFGYDPFEKLRRLDLDPRTPDTEPDDPSSRRESPLFPPAAPAADELLDVLDQLSHSRPNDPLAIPVASALEHGVAAANPPRPENPGYPPSAERLVFHVLTIEDWSMRAEAIPASTASDGQLVGRSVVRSLSSSDGQEGNETARQLEPISDWDLERCMLASLAFVAAFNWRQKDRSMLAHPALLTLLTPSGVA